LSNRLNSRTAPAQKPAAGILTMAFRSHPDDYSTDIPFAVARQCALFLQFIALWLLLAWLMASSAHAAQNQPGGAPAVTTAPIDAVTVFPGLAEVSRMASIELTGGSQAIEISDLPAGLLPDSLQAEPLDGATFTIGRVEVTQVFTADLMRAEERRVRETFETLLDQAHALSDRIEAMQARLAFIKALGKQMPAQIDNEIGRGELRPDMWRDAWQVVGEGTDETLAEIRKAEIAKRSLDRLIDQKRQELSQIESGRKSSLVATIDITSKNRGPAKLRLSYQVKDATWHPVYRARLDTGNSKVRLEQLAQVRQQTGEDWAGVKLTLSTARPGLGARMPQLETWFVDFAPLPGSAGAVVRQEMFDRLAKTESAAVPQPEEKEERDDAVAIDAGEFAARYRVPGQVDLTSGRENHMVQLANHDLDATMSVLSVPKLGPRAYLHGVVAYHGDAPLLAGPVSIYRDGTFAGRSAIDLTRPDEDIKLSFGADDRVRVSYRLVTGEKSTGGLISTTRKLERRYAITVANYHRQPVDLTVYDQLPVPRDERITVALLKDTTPPDEQEVDGRKGVLAWTGTYAPQEEREIRFGYAVSYPDELKVPGF
jgi:uncharacterized protein (TIGR02231 family)